MIKYRVWGHTIDRDSHQALNNAKTDNSANIAGGKCAAGGERKWSLVSVCEFGGRRLFIAKRFDVGPTLHSDERNKDADLGVFAQKLH